MRLEHAIEIVCAAANWNANDEESCGFEKSAIETRGAVDIVREHAKDIHMKNVYHRALAIACNFDDDMIDGFIESAEKDLNNE